MISRSIAIALLLVPLSAAAGGAVFGDHPKREYDSVPVTVIDPVTGEASVGFVQVPRPEPVKEEVIEYEYPKSYRGTPGAESVAPYCGEDDDC